ncbi:MAG: hypothetical protein KJI70_00190 [Patescibacteria group bacterium]|nr:hypothetical protein [Patescibacteria group bacterium]
MTKILALKTGLKNYHIILIALIFALVSIYIVQVGGLAKDRYLLGSFQKQLNSLSNNNKFLDIDFSKMNSLSHIDQILAKNSGFVKTNNVKYIKIVEGSIASRLR